MKEETKKVETTVAAASTTTKDVKETKETKDPDTLTFEGYFFSFYFDYYQNIEEQLNLN
jgi:hypothetical protein